VADSSKPLLIAVIVILLIAALFVIGPALSLSRGGASDHRLPWSRSDLHDLRARWFKPQRATLADLTGCPETGGALSFLGTCVVTVKAASAGSRDLIISGDKPAEVHYLPRSGPRIPMDFTLDPGKQAKFSVPKEGATLSLACRGNAPCRFQLEE